MRLIILVFLFSALVISCSEIFETPLSKKEITVLSPNDSIRSKNYSQTFWWELVEGVDIYTLQIVTPSFDSISTIRLDSVTEGNKVTVSLSPGKYQWRLRGENSGSETKYVVRTIFIDSSTLADQTVVLKSPEDDSFSENSGITFEWDPLFGTRKYRFQLSTDFGNESNLIHNVVVSKTSELVTLAEGKFYWRVRAERDSLFSQWSEIFIINYDVTPPAKVTLQSPAPNENVNSPVSLKWQSVAEAESYKVYLFKSDSTTFSSSYPANVSGTSFNFNAGSSKGKMFWQIKAVDRAGNEGELSEFRSFTVQ